MDLAPPWRPVTAGEGAAAVAQDDRPPDGSGEQPSLLTQVEDFTAAAEDGGQDQGVACQPADRGR